MLRPPILLIVLLAFLYGQIAPTFAQPKNELTAEQVLGSIKRGRTFLISKQSADGSWGSADGNGGYKIGITSLCLLSLINAGLTADDPSVARGLEWLRDLDSGQPTLTYEISLMIMTLAAAKDGSRDSLRIFDLAQRLESGQTASGGWTYYDAGGGGNPDHSNSQYAVLGLRDAAYYGTPVDEKVWKKSDRYWRSAQQPDGGWTYREGDNSGSRGSMTVAGISSLVICNSFLRKQSDVDGNGKPICCQPPKDDEALEAAYRWMGRPGNFSVTNNPNYRAWWLYYMYGLERAGRLSGRRFFGSHDWYREGARSLLTRQSKRDGSWEGEGGMESNPIIGTSFSLLFLSKGLAPVLVNKMKLGPRDPDNPDYVIGDIWNRHPKDVRNLVEHISTLPKWPKLLTWQVLDFDIAAKNDALRELTQAPILFLTSDENLSELMDEKHIKLLQDYLINGGFIFMCRGCEDQKFEDGVFKLVERLYPDGTTQMTRLPETHPVYRSEYLLDPAAVNLMGVDVGCRTAIIYTPEDLPCLWDKRMVNDPVGRPQDLKTAIARSLRIGVNVIAYVTGREPPNKLDEQELLQQQDDEDTLRGILKIAKLRHSGDWDAAPNAVKKLLLTLKDSFGVVAGTEPNKIPATDSELFRYSLLYMHGQRPFDLSQEEIRNVRRYVERGGVLFVDACCGSPKFDRSFRTMIKKMFPDIELERIPISHEIFRQEIGHKLESVKRRAPLNESGDGSLQPVERSGPPFLEGIKINDRYAVIYSKYDISCALEKQTSLSCIGYTPEDAAKIASNVVLYSVLQDVMPAGADE